MREDPVNSCSRFKAMGTARCLLCLGVLLACIGASGVAAPASASQIGLGPCDPPIESAPSKPASNARLRIDRDTAIQTLKHVQRACQLLQKLGASDLAEDKPAIRSKFKELIGRLGRGILEPIVIQYPDLRGQDFISISKASAEQCRPLSSVSPASEPKRCEPHMGPATASYLRRTINDAKHLFISATGTQLCKDREPKACIDKVIDIISEMGFSTTTIYNDYPQLWLIETRESLNRALKEEPRTHASDASFRRAAPPHGSVKLSPAALSKLRDFSKNLARSESSCEVIAILWVKETSWKKPDDAEWTKKGPGLSIGSYVCSQVPPEIIETQGGVKVMFSSDDPGRFVGELVDFESGEFVLKPDSAADPSSIHPE